MNPLRKLLVRQLNELTEKINSGNCEMTEEEAMDILRVISHESMSKEAACSYLNMPLGTFNDYVLHGKLPKGRKVRGFKEKRWYKDELEACIKELRTT